MQVSNTICCDCVHKDASRERQREPYRCQKKTSKGRRWGRKPAEKKTKARITRKTVTRYDYDYKHGHNHVDKGCPCVRLPDSEYDSDEEEAGSGTRGLRGVKSTRKERKTQGFRTQACRRKPPHRRTRKRPAPPPTEVTEDNSDDSLLGQVSDENGETECEDQAPRRDLKDVLKDVVGWSRTLSKEESDDLVELGKGSSSSRVSCKQSRHSI